MANLVPNGKQAFNTSAGIPLVGGKVFTYDAGTTNPRITWSDAAQTAPNTNPIILDARGEAVIFWSGAYKVQLQDSTGAVIWTVDNIQSTPGTAFDNYSADSGAANAYVTAAGITVSALAAGLRVTMKAANGNTGPSTLNYGGLGVKNIFLNNAALVGGEILANGLYTLEYDGVQFQLLNASALLTGVRSPAEVAALVVPVNYAYPVGDVRRYGAVLDGVTDDTVALNKWASVGGNLSFPLAATALITNTINLVSNSSITLAEGATIKSNTANFSLFKALAKTNIQIRGGTLQLTVNGATVKTANIELNGCTFCLVDGVELVGAQWAAVLLSDSSNCTVRACYIRNSLGCTLADVDTADISVYRASSFNMIEGNLCFGGTAVEHGIMIQDPGGNLWPFKNTVYGNRVTAHKSYGILNYVIDHANTYCTIENNEVEGITGTAQGGNSGCGIYNQGAGGTIIANNTIRNCCVNTTLNTLTPAGIGLNMDAANVACEVIGNTIIDMANFYGIEVVTGPANIVGNTVKFNAGVLANIGIYVNAASDVNVVGNHVSIDTSIANGQCIFVFANGVNLSNLSIANNYIKGGSVRGLRIDTSGAFTMTNMTVNGNVITGGNATCFPMTLANMILGSVTGNVVSSNTVRALDVASCTQTRIAGNVFQTTGANAVVTGGVCTGSYYDKSNFSNTGIANAATGMICEQLASATPGAGFNSAVGDRLEQSVPVVGNPKGWRCTVAGNPGTWVSEGNL